MLFQVKRGDPWANYSTEEEETVEETQIEPKKDERSLFCFIRFSSGLNPDAVERVGHAPV